MRDEAYAGYEACVGHPGGRGFAAGSCKFGLGGREGGGGAGC